MTAETTETNGSGSLHRVHYVLGISYVLIAAIIILLFVLSQRTPIQSDPYREHFDSVGTWKVGEGVNAQGFIVDGVYEMSLDPALGGDVFWATAGENFSDGIYEVEATPLEGAIDNGYGMLFRVSAAREQFYVFKVSGDGYVFIGFCEDSCLDEKALVNQDWFESTAVLGGFGVTNQLKAQVAGPDMIFYVNGVKVGSTSNDAIKNGDIGLIAETFTPGGLTVAFDNFYVLPLEDGGSHE